MSQEELITTSDVLLARLNCEVGLTKALTGFPEVRLPLPEMPKDYWQPEVREGMVGTGRRKILIRDGLQEVRF